MSASEISVPVAYQPTTSSCGNGCLSAGGKGQALERCISKPARVQPLLGRSAGMQGKRSAAGQQGSRQQAAGRAAPTLHCIGLCPQPATDTQLPLALLPLPLATLFHTRAPPRMGKEQKTTHSHCSIFFCKNASSMSSVPSMHRISKLLEMSTCNRKRATGRQQDMIGCSRRAWNVGGGVLQPAPLLQQAHRALLQHSLHSATNSSTSSAYRAP